LLLEVEFWNSPPFFSHNENFFYDVNFFVYFSHSTMTFTTEERIFIVKVYYLSQKSITIVQRKLRLKKYFKGKEPPTIIKGIWSSYTISYKKMQYAIIICNKQSYAVSNLKFVWVKFILRIVGILNNFYHKFLLIFSLFVNISLKNSE